MQYAAPVQQPAGRWMIAGAMAVGSFMTMLDVSMVSVAMLQMLGTFGVSLDAITWVAVAYSIAEIVLVTMAAWCSVLLGRKQFYLLGLALFTGASVLCGTAQSFEAMLLARVLQGLGSGSIIPVAQATVLEAFPDKDRGMAIAVHMVGVIGAMAVGPVVGGWLTDTYGWQWIFFINVPVGGFGLLLAQAVLTDSPHQPRGLAHVDLAGIGLLALGLTALQVVLVRGEREDWLASSFITAAALVALLALTRLVWWELRTTEPVVNLWVLRNVPFTAGISLVFIFGLALFGSTFLLPLFLQRLQGYTVLDSGLILMPWALLTMAFTPLVGRLYARVDSRLLVGMGLFLTMLGYLAMARFTLDAGSEQMLLALALTGAGTAFVFSILSPTSMRTVPLPLLPAASSLYTLARLVGGNIGYAFVASQVSYHTTVHGAALVDHLTPREGETMRLLDGLRGYLMSSGLSPGMAEYGALHQLGAAVQPQATMLAYVDTALLKKYAVPGPRYTSYPPAPVFSDAFGWQEYLHAVEASHAAQRPLSLYVHLPFCRSLCWYCGCNRVITHNRARITTYLEYVQREIGLLSRHLSRNREVVQLHWGGGSPSYLRQAEMLGLMRGLRQHFTIATAAEIGIELDPRDVRPGDAEALRAAGFNRVSFGVQDFHPDVQQAVHRVHPEECILEVFAQLRQAGFASINVDLLYGLPRQSLATFTDTIAKTIRMHPDRIALFNFAYLPALFKHQRMLNAAELPSADEKLCMLKMAIETLTAHGYVYVGMDHFAIPEDDLCQAQRNKTLYRNFQGYSTRAGCDLLAFGSSAIGQLADVYAQNHKALRAYCAAINAGIPATARGYHLLHDDQIRRHVIQQLMCHLVLEKARVEEHWQIDFDGYFAAELEALRPLEADGLVELTPAGVLVTDTGRLLLRNIAMVFDRYLREQQHGRPRYSRTV